MNRSTPAENTLAVRMRKFLLGFLGLFLLLALLIRTTRSQQTEPQIPVSTDKQAARQPDQENHKPSPQRGLRLLLEKAYLPADFHQSTFDQLWKCWPEPLRGKAEKASEDQRRQMAYSRYGLTERPDDPLHRPLQYVIDKQGYWSMNCLACHQGKVAGRHIAGAPNTLYALETLTDDLRITKLRLGKPLTRMETGSMFMPLGTTNGTTNAVMFGVVLMNYRDARLNIYPNRPVPPMTHHDHDAPAWWGVRSKSHLYADNFAPKNHRALMQFLLVQENGPEKFRQWEQEFRDIAAYIESIEPPRYPYRVDQELADTGRQIFNRSCAQCHGTYGKDRMYPEKTIPLNEIGTDPVRLRSLTKAHRQSYRRSWFAHFGKDPTKTEPTGYVAPPLDGIWASAPYFHNGAVPTLWHVLHPGQRPKVWSRSEDGYDTDRVGLEISPFEKVPKQVTSRADRRKYFDTSVTGKSAAGHDFPSLLNEQQRKAVLEYLKTL